MGAGRGGAGGGNFLAIHVGLEHFPPLLLAAERFLVIAVPTVLLVPRPRVRWRWLVGYGLGFPADAWIHRMNAPTFGATALG